VTAVHVVVPEGIDDPARPSGGNTYDRHLCRGLTSLRWSVHEHAVTGSWPRPDAASLAALAGIVGQIPDDALVLLDGLIASTAPDVLVPHSRRLRLVVLVHMPLGHRPADEGADDAQMREGAVLWLYSLPAERVQVAEPAVDAAELAPGTAAGGALLCVAAVTSDKGHDVLLDALAATVDLSWHCVCVGSLERDPVFVECLRRRLLDGGLGDRVCFPGPRSGAELDRSYAAADLMVPASRAETYGMVVTEALARGLPVVATEVGGLPEALGHGADGFRPGLLVAPDDAVALGGALRAWLANAERRERLRRAARERRESLPRWSTTTSAVAGVLTGVSR
jgi:glycosyltransferase involved in cell wall biosynthesis